MDLEQMIESNESYSNVCIALKWMNGLNQGLKWVVLEWLINIEIDEMIQ